MSVGPRVLLSRGARFQLSRSALGLSTLRAPSNAGCASPRGTRSGASLCRSGNLASPCRRPQSSGGSFCGICSVSAACAEWLEESTEGEPSGACVVLRSCRRSGTPQGIPAAEGRLQGSGFSAFIAPAEHRRGGKNRQIFGCRACPKYIVFWSQYAILH